MLCFGRINISGLGKSLAMSLISLGLLIVVVFMVEASYSAQRRSDKSLSLSRFLKLDGSTTIAIVQACQVIGLGLTTACLAQAFESIHWVLLDSINGLPYLSFLALSPSTGYMGTLSLVFASTRSGIPTGSRGYAVLK
jgi:hypothetical protein